MDEPLASEALDSVRARIAGEDDRPIVIVGGDLLALRVCAELCAVRWNRVTVLWHADDDLAERVRRLGAAFFGGPPNDLESLRASGIDDAVTIMALADDDHLNLQVALRARDENPSIRIVLRKFNRSLGRKIEMNLANCSVISLSTHAAATYAAAAVDPDGFYGLLFPDVDGELVGFATRRVRDVHLGGCSFDEAEARVRGRIVAIDGAVDFDVRLPLNVEAELTVFSVVRPRRAPRRTRLQDRLPDVRPLTLLRRVRSTWIHADTVSKSLLLLTLLLFVASTAFFGSALHLDLVASLYVVAEALTTVGFDRKTPEDGDAIVKIAAIFDMIAGVVLFGVFTALVTTRLQATQWRATQGLRPLRRRGHVVVCGAGNVGSRVIEYLLRLGLGVVVVEERPRSEIIDRARRGEIDLLTGDGTRDTTLDLCNLAHAEALIALTQSDTMNLEVALGARARNPELPIVMRVVEGSFAASVKRHFAIDRTFGSAALAAPAFAGLARFPGARGRVTIGENDYSIGELAVDLQTLAPPVEHTIMLAIWRNGHVIPSAAFADVREGDRVLYLFPVWRFQRDAEDVCSEAERRQSAVQDRAPGSAPVRGDD